MIISIDAEKVFDNMQHPLVREGEWGETGRGRKGKGKGEGREHIKV